MEVSNEKYKDFVFSSISENEQYKKVFIVSLHDDKEHMKENIPYVTIISNRYLFKLNNKEYFVPKIIKYLLILDKKKDKLIADDKILKFLDDYIRFLSKIERILLILRSDINNLDFYMLRKASKMIDILDIIIFEFKNSIEFFINKEYIKKLDNVQSLLESVRNLISNKVVYLDILNSRVLNIVSLSTLPILVLMTIWSTSVNENDSIISKNRHKILYRLTFVVSFTIICAIIYSYRKDFI